jgi:hypothetical protein
MISVLMKGAGRTHGLGRLQRQLILLFATVLTLGFLTPAQAQAAAAPGALLVKDASIVEGDASSVAVKIVLAKRVNHKVSVSYRTIAKSATSGVDFVAASGRVVIPAGTKARKVRISVLDDALDEGTERFRLRIFDAVGASISDRTGTVSILDDDPAPLMSVGDASVTEPASGSSSLNFPVSLSARSGRTVSVSYVVTAGTATSGTDYVASPTTGQLVLPAGATSGVISVSVLSDNVVESAETLQVTLYSPVHASIVDGSAVGTILDNTAPRLSVADVTVNEGDPARFVVSLNKPAPQTVTFRYSTSNGTASSSSDYTGVSNASGTIAAGASSTTITVNTTENTTAEPTETFNLTLSNVLNAVVADGQAVATILDDDGLPDLSIGNATVTEGGTASFTVTLSKSSTSPVTFTYATVDGTAVAGEDYSSASNNRTIPAGATSTTITVKTTEDTLDEADETFRVLLSNVANATVKDGDGLGTIADDDATPTLSINDPAAVAEGSPVTFTVTLSAKSGQTVTVHWATSNGDGNGGADDAVAPGDYAANSGTLTIAAGSTTGKITVTTVDDGVKEAIEAFTVTLSSPTNATIPGGTDSGIGLIAASD